MNEGGNVVVNVRVEPGRLLVERKVWMTESVTV